MDKSTDPFRIIIIGAGIAGLAAAIALRGPGRDITVLESSRMVGEIGAAISLQPNASKIVEKWWGLEEPLAERRSMKDKGFKLYKTTGEIQIEVPMIDTDRYGGNRMIYHRQDLHDTLLDAATTSTRIGNPATLRTSSRVLSCNPGTGMVTLESGQTLEADLIIGADGIKSNTRKELLGSDHQPHPTGISAYRLVIPTEDLEKDPTVLQHLNPRASFTTMIVGHDRRMVMGPCRQGDYFSIVALVPDEYMNEDSSNSTWTTQGDLDKCLKSFDVFPRWAQQLFRYAPSIGLWQLRDLDPLPTWTKGNVILIGDAAHAMLPTQGQGASQAVEDAEALGAFFADVSCKIVQEEVTKRLHQVFETRYSRATLIQAYSRQQAKPATEAGQSKIKLNLEEFTNYNYSYNGAMEWYQAQVASKKDSR